MKKRLGLLCLVFILISSSFCAVGAQSEFATRGKVLEMILTAADAYHEGIQASDIMKGDGDGNLRENDPVLRVEAMAMLSRAFPNLPTPSEYQLSIGNFGNEFIDLPEWAVGDLSNLTKAGIIAGYPDGRLGVDDNVTEEQMELLIRRIWGYLGNNQKDDFYATQNKPWFDSATLSASDLVVGTFQETESVVSQQLKEIIDEMVEGEWEDESSQQRVKEFYQAAADINARNEAGVELLKEYLDRYDKASSVKDLLEENEQIAKLYGSDILGRFAEIDVYTGKTYAPYIGGMSGILEKVYFTTEDEVAKKAYLKLVSDTLQLGGESKAEADRHAEQLYEMERNVALASLDFDENNLKNIYKRHTCYELYLQYPQLQSILDWWDDTGYFFFVDEGRVKKTLEYLNQDRLEVLKTYMKFWLIQDASSVMSQKMQQPYYDFIETMYGVEPRYAPEEDAYTLVQSYLGASLEETYVEKYGSEEVKQSVTQLVKDLRNTFKKRLEKADWMDEKTRKQAISKLSTMIVNVGYPEDFYDPFAESRPFDGTLFDNVKGINSYYYYLNLSVLGMDVDQTAFPLYSYTVNAVYSANRNSITVPMGILQAPFYDETAKPEENLAGIGIVIAHEMTHAFDDTGSQINSSGEMINWWTDKDRKAFEKKCENVVQFYDNQEISNHAKCNGTLTLGENIADLGAMACVLDFMKEKKHQDYQLFFTHYATIWRQYVRQEYANYLSRNDVHTADKLRVNRVVVNFQEFYDAFDIQPGDGMYVPPAERVTVW